MWAKLLPWLWVVGMGPVDGGLWHLEALVVQSWMQRDVRPEALVGDAVLCRGFLDGPWG